MTQRSLAVVSVTFQDAPGLDRTAQSLARQRTPPDEWIVVDGGTEGFSVPAAYRGLAKRVDIVTERDTGVYDAMTKGVRRATSSHVLFLNGGDGLAGAAAIEDARAVVAGDPDAIHCFDTVMRTDRKRWMRYARPGGYVRHGMPAIHQSIIYPRGALQRVLPPPAEIPTCGDYWMTARLWVDGTPIMSHRAALAEFYYGGISSSRLRPLVHEAWLVQREVLGAGAASRLVSASVRSLAFVRHRGRSLRN